MVFSAVLLEYLKSKHVDQGPAEILGTRLPCVSTRLPLWYTPTVTGEKRDVEYTSRTRSNNSIEEKGVTCGKLVQKRLDRR